MAQFCWEASVKAPYLAPLFDPAFHEETDWTVARETENSCVLIHGSSYEIFVKSCQCTSISWKENLDIYLPDIRVYILSEYIQFSDLLTNRRRNHPWCLIEKTRVATASCEIYQRIYIHTYSFMSMSGRSIRIFGRWHQPRSDPIYRPKKRPPACNVKAQHPDF